MTKLFLDCEYDGYGGQLISVAMVSECDEEFYAIVPATVEDKWVKENVMPVLDNFDEDGDSLAFVDARDGDISYVHEALEEYLSEFDDIEVIADWPEDISFFMDLLVVGPGERIDTPPLTAHVYREINTDDSKVPHNALEDARALKESYYNVFGGIEECSESSSM